MTPLKDTLEVANPAAENSGAAAGERPKSDSGGLRSDAVSLEVPVKVHGSRVTEVVRGITPHTEPFEEESSTMIVFPQGGVLRMNTAVTTGQMVVLTNLKTGHDAICRVVKVRACAQSQSYVEVEFTNRQQGYWGVKFANDAAEPSRTILPPPVPVVSTVVDAESDGKIRPVSTAPPVATKRPEPAAFTSPARPAGPVQHVPHPQKKESSFVAIGSQEDVQPAASSTTLKTKTERPALPAATLSMTELRGDATVAAPVSTALGAGVPGEVTDLSDDLLESLQGSAPAVISVATASTMPATAAYPAPQKVFGARFDSIASSASEQASDAPATSGTNWFFIATGIAALLVAAAVGAFYFHMLPGSKSRARIESAPPAVTLPATSPAASSVPSFAGTAPAGSNPSAPATQVAQIMPAPAAATAASGTAVRTIDPTPASGNRFSVTERVPSAANQKPARPEPDMSATLTEHPISSQRSAANVAEPAPSLDAGSSSIGDLQGLSSPSDLAPPPAAPEVRRGGDVHAPKLVSSILPIYPAMARSAGMGGNVVMEVSISATGAVVAAKVVSGPPLLRQAAVDAVRRWKYQPATLNGSAVPVDITVTMAFHN